jgi:hypothetical protein
MKQRLKAIFKGPVVFYPLLFAAFPILFLYAHNMSETSASQLWLPMGVSVAAALVLWIVLSFILRSLSKAGFATGIFLVFFFSYGRFYDVLNNWGIPVKQAYLFSTMLFVWGYCGYFINRAKGSFATSTKVLNVIAVVLIIINLFNIVSYQVKLGRQDSVTQVESTEQTPAAVGPVGSSTLPDIYFIILDEYAHADTMREWYDYDDSEFINNLEDKGFFIARESKTRTPNTQHVLAQILNMQYLSGVWSWDDSTREWVKTASAEVELTSEEAYQKIVDSSVVDFLKTKGYSYIYFGSWFEFDRYQQGIRDKAEVYFNYYESDDRSSIVSEFVYTLWDTTMLRPFYPYIAGIQYVHYYRSGVLDTLQHLKEMPDIGGPKLVFAHIACPHAPYVFGPNGEYIAHANDNNYEDKQFYLGQYIFISQEIEKVIDALLDESEIPPIIVLQSDHGQRPHHTGIVIGANEWKKVLNAMYLPGMDYSELSDSISPVNTFRLIFDHYFDADYALLQND